MANRVWKIGTGRAMVYVEGREALDNVLAALHEDTGEGKREGILGDRGNKTAAPMTSARPPRSAPKRTVVGSPAGEPAVPAATEVTAVYSNPRGKPFAWQIAVDAGKLAVIEALVGAAAGHGNG